LSFSSFFYLQISSKTGKHQPTPNMSSSDYGNENPAMHHKVEGNEMIDYSVIDQSPAITDSK